MEDDEDKGCDNKWKNKKGRKGWVSNNDNDEEWKLQGVLKNEWMRKGRKGEKKGGGGVKFNQRITKVKSKIALFKIVQDRERVSSKFRVLNLEFWI